MADHETIETNGPANPPKLDAGKFSDLFPIRDQLHFFDHAGVAPISGPAAEALRRYGEQASTRGYVDSNWQVQVRAVRRGAAQMIGADASEIAFVPNTSSGLCMIAGGLDWVEGDNVVITSVEYPANRYPWEDLRRRGVDLIEVAPEPDGRIFAEQVADAVTNRTRVVSVSHVQYSSGYRIDLRTISDMVHQAGGYLCVDAIQSLGAMPVDVAAMGIDFLSVDGHKWLLAPEGCGILYCRGDLVELVHPPVVGWMCMVDADRYGDYRFELRTDAGRFEPGSYNVPGVLALGASMALLEDVGAEVIWSRIEALTTRLCDGLASKGYRVFSPRGRGERSGIVVFEPPSGGGSCADVVAALRRQDIVIVVREGRLRASPHFYNTQEQIDHLLDALPA